MDIAPLLGIRKGLNAIIGSGGKTTLMYTLAEELKVKGRVIICTSTHIRIPDRYPLVTGDTGELESKLENDSVVCVGSPAENGKITAPVIPFDELERYADHVLVEADGSRGMPLKAHAEYEPVIPSDTERVILVLGADGLGKPAKEVCHRHAVWAEIAGIPEEGLTSPESIAKVIKKEGYGDIVFINKAEGEERKGEALKLAALLDRPVVIGSLKDKEYRECQKGS